MEIKNILERNTFTITVEYPQNTGNTLSRTEIEDIVFSEIGQNIPDNDVKFFVHTLDNKFFEIQYLKGYDKFLWNKAKVR